MRIPRFYFLMQYCLSDEIKRYEMGRHVMYKGQGVGLTGVLTVKAEGNGLPARLVHRQEDNIKTGLTETG